jgi:hypothetical protein
MLGYRTALEECGISRAVIPFEFVAFASFFFGDSIFVPFSQTRLTIFPVLALSSPPFFLRCCHALFSFLLKILAPHLTTEESYLVASE